MASAFGRAADAKHMVLYRFKPGEQLPQVLVRVLGFFCVVPSFQFVGFPPAL